MRGYRGEGQCLTNFVSSPKSNDQSANKNRIRETNLHFAFFFFFFFWKPLIHNP